MKRIKNKEHFQSDIWHKLDTLLLTNMNIERTKSKMIKKERKKKLVIYKNISRSLEAYILRFTIVKCELICYRITYSMISYTNWSIVDQFSLTDWNDSTEKEQTAFNLETDEFIIFLFLHTRHCDETKCSNRYHFGVFFCLAIRHTSSFICLLSFIPLNCACSAKKEHSFLEHSAWSVTKFTSLGMHHMNCVFPFIAKCNSRNDVKRNSFISTTSKSFMQLTFHI